MLVVQKILRTYEINDPLLTIIHKTSMEQKSTIALDKAAFKVSEDLLWADKDIGEYYL